MPRQGKQSQTRKDGDKGVMEDTSFLAPATTHQREQTNRINELERDYRELLKSAEIMTQFIVMSLTGEAKLHVPPVVKDSCSHIMHIKLKEWE